MRVLVTGSSGFIGKHLVEVLLRRGDTVIGVDTQSPTTELGRFLFRECNILDRPRLTRIISEFAPHAIVHLAARTDLEGKEIQDYAANVKGVENLVAAIRNTSSVRRCVFTSSQLVCRPGYVPKNDQDYCPHTVYGESKVLTERIVRQDDGGDIEWCIVRPTTIWGPGMRPHYQRFFRLIDRGLYFHIGSKPLYKSFGFVGNTVHQYLKLLEAPVEQIHKETFYLADYQPLSLRAWADAFQRELGAEPIKTLPEAIARIAAKGGDIFNLCGWGSFPFNSFRLNNILTEYVFDLSKTEKVCGPLPYTTEQGIKDTVAWLLADDILGR